MVNISTGSRFDASVSPAGEDTVYSSGPVLHDIIWYVGQRTCPCYRVCWAWGGTGLSISWCNPQTHVSKWPYDETWLIVGGKYVIIIWYQINSYPKNIRPNLRCVLTKNVLFMYIHFKFWKCELLFYFCANCDVDNKFQIPCDTGPWSQKRT